MAAVKALFVPMNSAIGGAERVLLDLLAGLDRRVFSPIVALREPGPLAPALHAIEVPTTVCRAPWWLPFDSELHPGVCFRRYLEESSSFVAPLCDLIERERVDVVYSAGTPILHGALAAHAARVAHLQHMQDLLGRPGIAYHLPFGRAGIAYRLAGRLSSLTVCVGETMRDDIGDAIPAEKCRVVPLGFRVPAADASVAAMSLPPAAAQCRVGIVGRVERLKGAAVIADVVQRVCAKAPETHFYWAGDGPPDLIARLHDAGRVAGEPHLHFVGFVDHIDRFMAAVDVLLHPARNDTFPRVVIEAALLQRALVVTRSGGVEEFVKDGLTGVTAPIDNAEALANALVPLVHNRDARARLGAAAFVHARRYDLASFQAGMQQALLDACSAGPALGNQAVAATFTAAVGAAGGALRALRRVRSLTRRRATRDEPLAASNAKGGVTL